MGEILSEKGLKVDQQSCCERLDQLVHNSAKPVSGFKLALAHIQANHDIVDILHQYEYRVIHLTRRNRIDQYISMRLAQINGIWRSDAGTYTIHSFQADPQHLQASVNTFRENDRRLLDLLHPLPIVMLTYEELTAETWCDKIMGFLGIPAREMKSPFVRQRRATGQRDAIENYDDVSRYFRGTELESSFVD